MRDIDVKVYLVKGFDVKVYLVGWVDIKVFLVRTEKPHF